MIHTPVLLNEVLEYLSPQPNENFIDATFGFGGHSLVILTKTAPQGRVLGIDADSQALEKFKEIKGEEVQKVGERLTLVCANFNQMAEIVRQENFQPVNGILFDLGFSSWQIEQSGRGFSFLRDEPLDMNYHSVQSLPSAKPGGLKACPLRSQGVKSYLSAEKIVNTWSQAELVRILQDYSEERFAQGIARAIISAREKKPITTTFQLVAVIKKAVPSRFQRGRLHPATRTFQALRITVNDEVNNLKKGLVAALEILAPGGRLVVISFHSLEDRIVKYFLRQQKDQGRLSILTKKPVRSSAEEVRNNPRSRSAKLRAAGVQ